MRNSEFAIGDSVDVLNPNREYPDPLVGWYQGVVVGIGHADNPFVDPKKLFYKVRKIDDARIAYSHSAEELRFSVNPNVD